MKKLTSTFSFRFFLAFVICRILLALPACAPSSPKVTPHTDTVTIVARNQANIIFLDSAIVTISVIKGFKDSGSLDGKWVIDTAYRLGQHIDTLYDKDRKPVLDTFHNPIVHFVYPVEATPRQFNNRIKVVDYLIHSASRKK